MTMQKMVEFLENKGFKTTKSYDSARHHYEFMIERNGIKIVDFFKYPAHSDSPWLAQKEFLDGIIYKFEKFEKGNNDMKNIAFDISRGDPVCNLVTKDDAYRIQITKVNYDGSPYNQSVNIEANVLGRDCMPKLSAETRKFVKDTVNNIYGTLGFTTFNPTRKDSINEGKVQIKDVIFNPPATIVFWSDGSKTVVKAENEVYDPEKGLAMAIAKRALGNQGNYFETFKKYVEPYNKKVEAERAAKIAEVNAALNRPYRIWYERLNDDNEIVASGVSSKEYKRRGDAARVAKRRYGSNSKVRYMVAQENPWLTKEWDKKFGSDNT